jgi:hypothetical protein
MAFSFKALSANIYLITWSRFPTGTECTAFLAQIEGIVQNADHPISFITDLRRGYIKDALILSRLSNIAQHPNFGPSTAFGGASSQVYAGIFRKLLVRSNRTDESWNTLAQALRYLETQREGITRGIDWNVVDEGQA